ncbi:hypothetical protein OE88DRAFT_1659288 [Heliocybe sulcata]|uniref:Uncharacterized protein n=1 Tax=Heliocybe sulcata TaxID=5364 RepID=A0A5C3N2U5_9AGAM|nr:hypothetical protein OE88DRAFT_1659288 [Heliocybe sulcata]
MAGSAPIFQPITQGGPVATLLLIENSREMAQYWPELRAHYLPTLLGTMRLANPVVPIQVLLMPTSAATTTIDKLKSPQMEYNEQLELGFNFDRQNRIMPSTIQRAIHSLASTFEGVPSTRHLIVVAASDAAIGTDIGLMSTVHTGAEWQVLSNQLVQHNVQLHMILRAEVKMDILTDFFYTTLQAQGKTQGTPWFKTDERKYRLLLSAERKFPISPAGSTGPQTVDNVPFSTDSSSDMLMMSSGVPAAHSGHYASLSAATPTSPMPEPEVVYPSPPLHQAQPHLLRSQTFPPPAAQLQAAEATATTPPDVKPEASEEGSPKPSLVTRIKKIHGMTKRRTYGANANLRPPLTRTDLSQSQSAGSASPNSPGTSRGPLPYQRSAAPRAQHLSPAEGPATLGPRRKSRAHAPLDTKAAQMPDFPEEGALYPEVPMTDSTPSSPTTSAHFNALSSLTPLTPASAVMSASSAPASFSVQQDEYFASTDPSGGSTGIPISTAWSSPEDASGSQAIFPETPYQFNALDTYGGQQWMSDESWESSFATPETLQSLQAPAGNAKELGPLPISGIPLATSASIMTSPTRVSLPFASSSMASSAPTSPAMDGDQPFIFNAEYEAQVSARYEETIRAAGISQPVVSAQRRHSSYTVAPPVASTASRPPLYVSTHSSPTQSGPPSLQVSPVVATDNQGYAAYGPCGAPLQQGPPPADSRYYNPLYGAYV